MKKGLKFIFLFFFLFLFLGCFTEKKILNREVEHSADGKVLLGLQQIKQFEKEPYHIWFDEFYYQTSVDFTELKKIKKNKLNSVKFTIFIATWQKESQENFPKIIKILKSLSISEGRIKIYAVNRKFSTPSGDEASYGITKIPMLVIEKYEKELGKIYLDDSFLEEKIVEILNK